ncbi:hypothetical protein OGATHE_003192 [Ogataea polymorpha]|uniref:Uncharacterized protein n=1 Tax=Ogataea polymorpha TaxID=460523 RepID=A0A9P8T6Q6_9ASCO|nr:hypothetical protein OGATHE_003192 [Ogataea polymorpha]
MTNGSTVLCPRGLEISIFIGRVVYESWSDSDVVGERSSVDSDPLDDDLGSEDCEEENTGSSCLIVGSGTTAWRAARDSCANLWKCKKCSWSRVYSFPKASSSSEESSSGSAK